MTVSEETKRPFRLISWAKHLHAALAIVTFAMAAVHLFLVRNSNLGGLVLFFLPPIYAAAYWKWGVLPSTRLLSASFLLLLMIGDVIAPFPNIFPGLNEFPDLTPKEDRILSWYTGIYIFYFFVVLPPPMFVRPLIQRHRGQLPYFSRPTCYLGLAVWLIMVPFFAWASAILLFASNRH